MALDDRRGQILSILAAHGTVSVGDFAKQLHISESSVRRDLALMEEEGVVRRVHGGAMLTSNENAVVPLSMRDGEHSAQKERLARRAAAMVQDGDIILLDASSTVRRMVKYLAPLKNLTIITNNARILDELGPCSARVYCTGGEFLRENHAFAGPAAEAFIRTIWADKLFFSSQGVSAMGEVSDHSEAETTLRRVMLQRAAEKICLLDDSKLGRRCVFRLCGRDEVDVFLCERELPWE